MGHFHIDTPDITQIMGDRKIERYKGERKCRTCKKLLSRYNPNEYCFVHTAEAAIQAEEKKEKINTWKRRSSISSKVVMMKCENCRNDFKCRVYSIGGKKRFCNRCIKKRNRESMKRRNG